MQRNLMKAATGGAALLLAGLTAACATDAGSAAGAKYPFVGSWDCGVAVMKFTDTTYTVNDEELAIASVEQNGTDYSVTMADGYSLGLSNVTASSMAWFSPQSGDSFECTRVAD